MTTRTGMHVLPRRTNLRILLRRPGRIVRKYGWLLGLLLIAAALDAVTTWRNMRLYGPGIEMHPVQQLVSHMVGVNFGVPLAKLIQAAFVVLVAMWWRPWSAWILGGCAALYTLAAASNHWLWL